MASEFTPEETLKIIEEYNAKRAAGIPIDEELATAMKDAAAGQKQYTDQMKVAVDNLKSQTLKFGQKMVDGESGLKTYNDVTAAGIDVLGEWGRKLPILGKYSKATAEAVKTYVKLANQQGDKIYDEYQKMSRSGLVLGMEDTFKNLEETGYTVAEFADYQNLMIKNATNMAQFAGTSADGAKRFADVSKTLNQSGSVEKLMLLGKSMNDINDSSMNYLRYQRLSGSSRIQTTQELADHTKDFIEAQDRLTKLTGMNSKQQNEAKDRMLKMEQYAGKNAQLQAIIDKGGPGAEKAQAEKEQNEALYTYMSQFGQKNADNMVLLITDSINSPGWAEAARAMPKTQKLLEERKKRTVTTGEMMNAMNADAEDVKKMQEGSALLGNSNKWFGDYSGFTAQSSAATTNYVKAEKEAKESQKKQESGTVDSITGNMVKMLLGQRNTTQDADKLINKGIEPLTKGFNKVTGIAQELSGVIDVAINKQDRFGGGQTMIQKGWNAITGGGAGATVGVNASAVGGGASAPLSGASSTSAQQAQSAPVATPALSPSVSAQQAQSAPVATPALAPSSLGTPPGTTETSQSSPTLGQRIKGALGAAKTEAGAGIASGMEAVKQMIIRHEGIKTRPYQDSKGLWTVGVGHLIGDGRSLPADMNREFSKEEVMSMFEQDFAKHLSIAQMTPGWDKAGESAKAAMVDLAYNMGQWWNKFPATAKALAAGDFAGAAAGLKDSKWFQQIGNRAVEITNMMSGGNKPHLAIGGVVSGPITGYQATLHGNEAVVPLPNGKSIPVQSESDDSNEQVKLLSMKIQRLDSLIMGMQKHAQMSTKILQLHS